MDNPSMQQPNNDSDTIVIRDLLRKYIHQWYWFVLSVVLCLIGAMLYLKTQTPKYSVSTKVMIRGDEDSDNAGASALHALGFMSGSRHVQDELQVINSKTLMRQVIQALNIQTSYSKHIGWRYIEEYPNHSIDIVYPELFCDTMLKSVVFDIEKKSKAYEVKLKYGKKKYTYNVATLEQPINTPFGSVYFQVNKLIEKGDEFRIKTSPMPSLVGAYQGSVVASQEKHDESNVIEISTTSPTPKKAMDILDKLVELYNMDAYVDKNMIATATGRFIEERLKLITEELSNVEQDVEDYKKANQLTDIASEASIYLSNSQEYQRQLAELDIQLNLVQYVQDFIQDENNKYAPVPANLGINDVSLQSLLAEYNKDLMNRNRLLRTTNESNPVIQQLEDRLVSMRSNIIGSIYNIKNSISVTKRSVQSRDRQFVERIKNVPTQEREYLEIKRQQQIKENLYMFLYQKREENALTLASTIQPAKTIDKADYNRTPVAPKRTMILLIALLIGLAIPVVVMYLYDLIYDQIVDRREFDRVHAPFAGEISKSKVASRVVVTENRSSSIAELFRLLRTNLNFMLAGNKHPVIVVTSSYTGEGKSFVSINLAASLALMQKRVLLIGLDVRNPKLSNYLELDRVGHFTEYLSGSDFDDEELIYPSNVADNLYVVPAGSVPPNPGELMLSPRLEESISRWREQFDYIIIDSAPVGVVSDTFLLNRISDMTLYISRSKYTPRSAIELINELYDGKKLNNIACVLNDVDRKAVYGGYYYYHGRRRSAGKYYSYIND